MTNWMLESEKVLITGATGKIAFPIARALVDARLASTPAGQTISYCLPDEDPVQTAERLRPVLEKRWSDNGVEPLFAAPFYTVVPYEWDRYVP